MVFDDALDSTTGQGVVGDCAADDALFEVADVVPPQGD